MLELLSAKLSNCYHFHPYFMDERITDYIHLDGVWSQDSIVRSRYRLASVPLPLIRDRLVGRGSRVFEQLKSAAGSRVWSGCTCEFCGSCLISSQGVRCKVGVPRWFASSRKGSGGQMERNGELAQLPCGCWCLNCFTVSHWEYTIMTIAGPVSSATKS